MNLNLYSLLFFTIKGIKTFFSQQNTLWNTNYFIGKYSLRFKTADYYLLFFTHVYHISYVTTTYTNTINMDNAESLYFSDIHFIIWIEHYLRIWFAILRRVRMRVVTQCFEHGCQCVDVFLYTLRYFINPGS